MPKYLRTPGQAEALVHNYEDEILKLNRMIALEDDERTKRILKELRDEHIEAKRRLENFLNSKDVFK